MKINNFTKYLLIALLAGCTSNNYTFHNQDLNINQKYYNQNTNENDTVELDKKVVENVVPDNKVIHIEPIKENKPKVVKKCNIDKLSTIVIKPINVKYIETLKTDQEIVEYLLNEIDTLHSRIRGNNSKILKHNELLINCF